MATCNSGGLEQGKGNTVLLCSQGDIVVLWQWYWLAWSL